MANTLDLLINADGSGLIRGGSFDGEFPELYRNDITKVRLRLMEDINGTFVAKSLTSPTFKLGLGDLDEEPTSGEFKLSTTTGTSAAIAYNATTTQVLNAVSAIAGNVSVATFGIDGSAWLITAATNNSALSFSGISFTLFPNSSVFITTRRTPAVDIKAEQIIQLRQDPLVEVTSFATVSTANSVTLSKIQDGSSTQNETYRLKLDDTVQGGSFALIYGTNTTSAIQVFDGGTSVDSGVIAGRISAISGIGAGNIGVESNSTNSEYIISFVGSLGLLNISTALVLDKGGVIHKGIYEGTLTMGSAGIEAKFAETQASAVDLTLEVQLTEDSNQRTILQRQVSVARDLLSN